MLSLSRRARELGTENAFVVLGEVAKLQAAGKDILSLRTGYDFNADEIKWSAGAGAKVPINTMRGSVDYSYSDGGLLGPIHQVSVGVRF